MNKLKLILILAILANSNASIAIWSLFCKKPNTTTNTIIETKISGPQPSQESTRKVYDPFEYVTGITEKEFKKIGTQERKKFFNYHTLTITNQATDQIFSAGIFDTFSIGSLREQFKKNAPAGSLKFNIVEGYDKPWENWFRHAVDIGALQADPQNRNAIFQVASNFNGLEGSGDPYAGIMPYLSPYLYVQGEAAALSAMPGLIYRMYYVKHTIDETVYFGQLTEQINFLRAFDGKNLPEIRVHNGYIQLDSQNQKLNSHFTAFSNWEKNPDQKRPYVDDVCIGLHTNIQVTGGFGPQKSELPTYKATPVTNPNQKINQVLTATANLAGLNQDTHEGLARMLLQAAYEGTIYASAATGSNKIFLTLVGGGVFNNKLSWIIDELEHAVRSAQNKDLDITLIIYHSQGYPASEWNTVEQKLLKLVNDTQGTWTRYKKDGIYHLSQ